MIAILQISKFVSFRMGAGCTADTSSKCARVVMRHSINYFIAPIAKYIMSTISIIRVSHSSANMITFNCTALRAYTINKRMGLLGDHNAIICRVNLYKNSINFAGPLATSTLVQRV